MTSIRILGIDPGFQVTGYGLIDMDGNHLRSVAHGLIRVSGADLGEKLRAIYRGMDEVLERHAPMEVAVERVFVHRNADSALKLGQARGTAVTACAQRDLPIFEYTPNQVKQAMVGRGHAAKQQVQHMVKVLLCLAEIPPADAADALGLAICHGHYRQGLSRMAGVAGARGGRLR